MDNKIIKVAQIIGHTCNGGVESFVYNYYKAIDKTKIQFDFFVDNESKIINKTIINSMGGEIKIIPSVKRCFKLVKTLRKYFRENQYDIVHANLNSLNFLCLYAAKKEGIKVRISHSHSTSSFNEPIRNLIKKCLKIFSKLFVTHYFACSTEAGKWLFGGQIASKENFFVINNGIDIDRFAFNSSARKDFRKSLKINENTVLFGASGRFVTQKNHMFLIELFNNLEIKSLQNAKLLLIGEGKLKEQYISYISKNEISNVIILDSVADIEKFYNGIDVFLFPSLYEGLGISLIEAQCNGLVSYISNFIPQEAILSESTVSAELSDNKRINLIKRGYLNHERHDIDCEKFNILFCARELEKLYLDFVRGCNYD